MVTSFSASVDLSMDFSWTSWPTRSSFIGSISKSPDSSATSAVSTLSKSQTWKKKTKHATFHWEIILKALRIVSEIFWLNLSIHRIYVQTYPNKSIRAHGHQLSLIQKDLLNGSLMTQFLSLASYLHFNQASFPQEHVSCLCSRQDFTIRELHIAFNVWNLSFSKLS